MRSRSREPASRGGSHGALSGRRLQDGLDALQMLRRDYAAMPGRLHRHVPVRQRPLQLVLAFGSVYLAHDIGGQQAEKTFGGSDHGGPGLGQMDWRGRRERSIDGYGRGREWFGRRQGRCRG